jgi:hypothetical protein
MQTRRDVPANTIRAWVIGMFATTVVSGVNLLFSLRNPSINIYVYVVQLLAYPVGVGMARVSGLCFSGLEPRPDDSSDMFVRPSPYTPL